MHDLYRGVQKPYKKNDGSKKDLKRACEIDKVRKGREGQGMDDAACGTKHGCMKHEAQGRYGMGISHREVFKRYMNSTLYFK